MTEKFNSGERVTLNPILVDEYGTDLTGGEVIPDDVYVVNNGQGTVICPSGEPIEHYEIAHDTEGRLSVHPDNLRRA